MLVHCALCYQQNKYPWSLDGTSLLYRCQEPTYFLCYLRHRCTAGIRQCLEVNSVKGRPSCPVLDTHVKAVPPPGRAQVPPRTVLPVNDVLLDGSYQQAATTGCRAHIWATPLPDFFLSKGRGLCLLVLGFSGVWEGISGQGCTCLLCPRSFYLLKECCLHSVFFLWVKYEVFIQILCWISFISMLLIYNMNLQKATEFWLLSIHFAKWYL